VSDVELIGLAAGLLVASGLIPQILRVWRLKDAQEISLLFNLLTLAGTILWLGYGITLGLVSVIVWNGANTILLIMLLSVKVKYGMSNNLQRQHETTKSDS
jgi:MtN3 and saliva related transmembrane protein